jgi:hypothetical protein
MNDDTEPTGNSLKASDSLCSISGSLAMLAAMRWASSLVSSLVAERRLGFSSK